MIVLGLYAADKIQKEAGAHLPGGQLTENKPETTVKDTVNTALPPNPHLDPDDDDSDKDRNEWKFEHYDSVKYSDRFKAKYYRDPKILSENGKRLWWSKDKAGHGGSRWKLYEETGKGLKWYKDVDKFVHYIKDKHKGPIGKDIPWEELVSVQK
jgi:hypothetical protein